MFMNGIKLLSEVPISKHLSALNQMMSSEGDLEKQVDLN